METDDSLDRAGEPQSDRRWEEEGGFKGKATDSKKEKKRGEVTGRDGNRGKNPGPTCCSERQTDRL